MNARIPNWADSIEDLKSYIATAQMRAMNKPSTSGTGAGIHVGIIDSHSELPGPLAEPYHVNEGSDNSFISDSGTDSNAHGVAVFDQLSAVAPNAEFSVYRAIDDDGNLRLDAYADAISKAIEDEVDIVNVSAGDPWPAPIDLSPIVRETRRLLDQNVPVVAAAGTPEEDRSSKPPVHCPSAARNVISVGAYVTTCPCEPGEESTSTKEGPYYCLFDKTATTDIETPYTGTYCGEQGCVDGRSCITNQTESTWEGNPLPTGNKPDVVAPMHIVRHHPTDGPFIDGGTSFAAPLVTGSLACIFSELEDEGKSIPPPKELRHAVRHGSAALKDSQFGKYDAMGTRSVLTVG